MIKKLVTCLLLPISRFDLLWGTVGRPLFKLSKYLVFLRGQEIQQRLLKSLPESSIQDGPFEGMRYPDAIPEGKNPVVKLLGTYELELAEVVEELATSDFEHVIDVGCAEGYYAIGFARRLAKARVLAFDISPEARRLCQQMAEDNDVGSRVEVRELCRREDLLALPKGAKGFIISDCEGGEADLFDEEVGRHLTSSTILIECHDNVIPGITDRLEKILEKTHKVRLYHSNDDLQKGRLYRSPAVDYSDIPEVMACVYGEGRPIIMNWIVARPLSA